MRGFLMGGLFGAALALYLNKSNNREMLMTNMDKMANSLGDMFDTATDKMKEMTFNQMTKNMDENIKGFDNEQGLEQIQDIINEDPKVKAESDKILKDSEGSITQ
ncbi:YtxH domain-containing protein [Chengkuizengella sediminis]|uniref:YtxH domain-containing protein n=1 Tax=Chengkuizengella sediminis TaxID=1885917 RepID=UPI0013896882|nr:YtxH domain-containing protein [Chengkuizengella sediminis]NDI34325.1 YtxH domain-containing protein [Chengkuizengella sediminis]